MLFLVVPGMYVAVWAKCCVMTQYSYWDLIRHGVAGAGAYALMEILWQLGCHAYRVCPFIQHTVRQYRRCVRRARRAAREYIINFIRDLPHVHIHYHYEIYNDDYD